MGHAFTLWPIVAVTFDATISVGNIISGIAVAVALFLGRKFYDALVGFVDTVHTTESIVDDHSDVLVKAGWAKGKEWPRVSERRRRERRAEERLS